MQQRTVTILTVVACLVVTLSVLGAAARQGVPPFPVAYSGSISIEGEPATGDLLVLACVAGCVTGWEGSEELGQAVRTNSDGTYAGVIVGPPDESFVGEEITFWIETDFGERIKAVQTVDYDAELPLSRILDLDFDDPLPEAPTPTLPPTATTAPEPTATLVLPIPGDGGVPTLFRWALIAGAAALAVGGVTFFWFHRRRTI